MIPFSRVLVLLFAGGLLLLFINDWKDGPWIDSDRLGSLVYLGILGAVLASGILASGRRFGETARMLAIWLLVILAIMAGYEYRYELQDFASRMSGGLISGSPLSATDAEGRSTVTLRKRLDGHFEAHLSVNGNTIVALVDTGASTTVLSADDARKAGFDPAGLSYTVPVQTANGRATAARIVASEMAVGAITRRNVPLLVAEAGRLEQSLLGMNFIGTLSAFELRGDRLILRD